MKNQEIKQQQIKWDLDTDAEKRIYLRGVAVLHLTFYIGIFYYLFF